jgi:DNA-directed RNA polymerase specialized sigma24 family protein
MCIRKRLLCGGRAASRRRKARPIETAELRAAAAESSFLAGDVSAVVSVRSRLEAQVRRLILLRFAGRLGLNDVDDVVQDTIWRAWTAPERFNPAQGRFSSWLLGIAFRPGCSASPSTWRARTRVAAIEASGALATPTCRWRRLTHAAVSSLPTTVT